MSSKKEKVAKKPPIKAPASDRAGGGAASGSKSKQQAKVKPPAHDNEDVKREQKLQAIVLADSFNKTFRPITLESPKVLLPLVNVPMLEYTIEFLVQNGVEEIFVFCASHADKVEAYIKERKWTHTVSIRCISSPACSSAGDALREIDVMNVIRSDPFILISGDVVSNLDLKKAIAYHKAKRRDDNNAIMTVVLKTVSPSTTTKPILDDLVVGMNSHTGQIVIFEDSFQESAVSLPVELMEDATELVFRNDLLDCNVDICSPELILQFSDNFDYQDIRRDFIQNEVSNFALGKHIYGYLLKDEYAARVQDPRTYHSISRDIITRWVYPLVPEVQLLQDSSYSQGKRYNYREQNVRISRTANITESVVLGANTTIADRSVLTRCTVGRDVVIGSDVSLTDSHVWSNAVIEDGAAITEAIICAGCVIGSHAVIPRGCIVSYGVVIPPNTVLPEFARVFRRGLSDDPAHSQLPGTDAQIWVADASVWPASYDASLGALGLDQATAMRSGSIGCTDEQAWRKALWRAVEAPEDEEDSDCDMLSEEGAMDLGARKAVEAPQVTASATFLRAVEELVATASSELHDMNSVLMEIKSMKFAQNKSFGDCLRGVLPGLLVNAMPQDTLEINAILRKINEMFASEDAWACVLIDALVQDEADQVVVIEAVEDFVLLHRHAASLNKVFRFILQKLFQSEAITKEGCLAWIADREDDESDDEDAGGLVAFAARRALFLDPHVQEFVTHVQEESDEEDEEEDEEESEGEDDDDA